MASSIRSSSLSSKPGPLAKAGNKSPKPFHGPKFFKVLGRIDEESSFRSSSISNLMSQDISRDYSTTSSDEASTELWEMPLSPSERCGSGSNDPTGEEQKCGEPSVPMLGHRLCQATIVTTIDDRSEPDTGVAEGRQDQSSPAIPPSLPPTAVDVVSAAGTPSPHRDQRDPNQYRQKRQQRLLERQRSENDALRAECEALERTILQMRNKGNLLRMRTSLRLNNFKDEIERATSAKQALEEECRGLQDQIRRVRVECAGKQEKIRQAEEDLRERRKRRLREERERKLEQQRRYSGASVATSSSSSSSSSSTRSSNHRHRQFHHHGDFGMKNGVARER